MIQKHTVSRDDSIYHAFPDLALLPSDRLVCIFAECNHHNDRSYTRVMLTDSDDRGITWSPKRALTDPLQFEDDQPDYYWNCPRITLLSDGRLVGLCDTPRRSRGDAEGNPVNWMWISPDEGQT